MQPGHSQLQRPSSSESTARTAEKWRADGLPAKPIDPVRAIAEEALDSALTAPASLRATDEARSGEGDRPKLRLRDDVRRRLRALW
jgi:hypothetical protein